MSVENAIKIASKTNYLNKDITYLKNIQLVEWDIHSAGLSVLKYKKLLPEKELEELSNMDKHKRTVKEGLLQRENPNIAAEIVSTLSKAVQAFVILNKIDDSQILSIKKDALFLINANVQKNVIKEYFEFRKKNVYTSYLYLGRIEIYYNSITNEIEFKGISDECINECTQFVDDFKKLLKASEMNSHDLLFNLFKSYCNRYLNRSLPIESYREMKSGKFRIGEYLLDNVSDDDIDKIDISQNYLNFIIPLINAIL